MNIPFRQGLTQPQQQSITNLINTGRKFNETDARNFAYATGGGDFNRFIGLSGQGALNLLSGKQSQPQISQLTQTNKVAQQPVATSSLTKPTYVSPYSATATERKSLQEKILANLQPTEQETLLQKQINNILSRYEASVPALEGQGRGIPLPIIRGQQAKLEQQAQAQLTPLQRQLGLEQTQRTRALTAAQEAYKMLPERQAPVALSAGQTMYDPETGEAIFSAPSNEKYTTLSAGQSIIDPKTGEVIYTSPEQKDLTWGVIGQTIDPTTFQVVNKYGWIDKSGQIISPQNIYDTDNPYDINTFNQPTSNYLNQFDISSYATDPNHENSINSILNNIGQFKTLPEIDTYIKSKAPNSPITGQMVANASRQFGVPWEIITAIMQQDSNFGTAGVGAKTFNPGNVGNFDSGEKRNYGNWQDGVNAVAQWLNNHRGQTSINQNAPINPQTNAIITPWITAINSGKATLADARASIPKGLLPQLLSQLIIDEKASDLQKKIWDSAQKLKNMWDSGNRVAIGGSSILNRFDWMALPGSKGADFINQYNNLKGLLSLENVKYLKGQGQISDAERALLANASSNLNRFSSESTFGKNLQELYDEISDTIGINISGITNQNTGNNWMSPSGKIYNLPNL